MATQEDIRKKKFLINLIINNASIVKDTAPTEDLEELGDFDFMKLNKKDLSSQSISNLHKILTESSKIRDQVIRYYNLENYTPEYRKKKTSKAKPKRKSCGCK
jgi:hypothetical protein